VLSTATALQGSDVPADFPQREALYPDGAEWVCDGDAVIVRPFGGPVAGPLHREKAILAGEIVVAAAVGARRSLDDAGHYSRPEIFRLEVNNAAMPPHHFAAMAAEHRGENWRQTEPSAAVALPCPCHLGRVCGTSRRIWGAIHDRLAHTGALRSA
jgi:hypothetical protein